MGVGLLVTRPFCGCSNVSAGCTMNGAAVTSSPLFGVEMAATTVPLVEIRVTPPWPVTHRASPAESKTSESAPLTPRIARSTVRRRSPEIP